MNCNVGKKTTKGRV